uniref:protein-histidine N-methyltransferase n=1 Tax=Trypanosoma congolense (strain IL3000) TaxID=1068625 RepID=F9WES8_TRYCI|nr:unnamed protein product [Trypanosoma congolense IL3000]
MSGGFHFKFSDDTAESTSVTTEATHSETQGTVEPVKSVPFLNAPVHLLTRQLLEEWCLLGQQNPQEQIELQCHKASGVPLLAHQRAPRVEELTVVGGREYRDIVPGKYYGGLKVWSCAPYLMEYMFDNRDMFRGLFRGTGEAVCDGTQGSVGNAFRYPIVIELGCGQGLPGVAALLIGARHVLFQDYNDEVLELCVKPNIGVNLRRHMEAAEACAEDDDMCPTIVQLVSGDWGDMHWDGVAGGSVAILGSDVTFDEEACRKLAQLLQRLLSSSSGMAWIASKQYYFGTSGGVLEFTQRCNECKLTVVEVSSSGAGGGMHRVILLVRYQG